MYIMFKCCLSKMNHLLILYKKRAKVILVLQ